MSTFPTSPGRPDAPRRLTFDQTQPIEDPLELFIADENESTMTRIVTSRSQSQTIPPTQTSSHSTQSDIDQDTTSLSENIFQRVRAEIEHQTRLQFDAIRERMTTMELRLRERIDALEDKCHDREQRLLDTERKLREKELELNRIQRRLVENEVRLQTHADMVPRPARRAPEQPDISNIILTRFDIEKTHRSIQMLLKKLCHKTT